MLLAVAVIQVPLSAVSCPTSSQCAAVNSDRVNHLDLLDLDLDLDLEPSPTSLPVTSVQTPDPFLAEPSAVDVLRVSTEPLPPTSEPTPASPLDLGQTTRLLTRLKLLLDRYHNLFAQ
jgi:hypothetical protein